MVDCGKKEVSETHHIKSWRDFPELRFEVSNGKTLCLDCHKKYRLFGRPKMKNGKRINLYLSIGAISNLQDKSWKQKKSMSALVEEFANG
jgi:hypothetical protein